MATKKTRPSAPTSARESSELPSVDMTPASAEPKEQGERTGQKARATRAAAGTRVRRASSTGSAPATRRASVTAAPPRRAAKPAPTNGAVVRTQGRPPAGVTDEDIRMRAYFLSLEHSGEGNEFDFWVRAERELRGEPTEK